MGNQQVSSLTAIPGYCGYFFDENANIFSNKGRGGSFRKLTPHVHRKRKTKKNYKRVKIKDKLVFVHRLVGAYLYGGVIPPHLHVNHLDGDAENNKLSNLEVVSHLENVRHAKEAGLYCSGESWRKARGLELS